MTRSRNAVGNGIQRVRLRCRNAHELHAHFPHGPYNTGASDRGSITVPCMRALAPQFHPITIDSSPSEPAAD